MPDDDAGFFRQLRGLATDWVASKRRSLAADPTTNVDSASAGTGYSFSGQDTSFEQLREIKQMRESGGTVAQLMDHKALLNFGEGATLSVENNEDTEQPVDGETMTLGEWLTSEAFPDLDLLVLDLGGDALWYPSAVGEFQETQTGAFKQILPAEPWTVKPICDERGTVTAYKQRTKAPSGGYREQTLPTDEMWHIVVNKSSARDETGISEVLRNREEIDAYRENEEAIRQAIELHGFPQRHVKVGSEGGAPINDDDLRRVRTLFDPHNTDANTAYFTGQDVNVETLEAQNFDYTSVHEMDMRNLTTALGLPLEAGNVGSDGLGSGKPAELRFAMLKLAIKANQRSFATQFVDRIVRPVVRDYSPFDHTADISMAIDDPLEDVGETADLINKVGGLMTNAEKRRRLDLPEPEDDDVAESYRTPADIEAAEAGEPGAPDEPLSGLFSERRELADLDPETTRAQIRDHTLQIDRPTDGGTRAAFHTPTDDAADAGALTAITDTVAEMIDQPVNATATDDGVLFESSAETGVGVTEQPHVGLDIGENAAHDELGGETKSTLMVAGDATGVSLQPCFELTDRLADDTVATVEDLYEFVAGVAAEGYHNENRFYLDTGRNELPHVALDVAEILVRRETAGDDTPDVTGHSFKVLPEVDSDRTLAEIPNKYTDGTGLSEEDFVPNADVEDTVDGVLEFIDEEGLPNPENQREGAARANQLKDHAANDEHLEPAFWQEISNFHARHRAQGNHQCDESSLPAEAAESEFDDCYFDPGYFSDKTWGGDAGKEQADRIVEAIEDTDGVELSTGETDFSDRALGGVTDRDLEHAPEWDASLLQMYRGVTDPESDPSRTLVSFAASDAPEFVLDRIRDAVDSGAMFAEFDGISSDRQFELREQFKEILGTDDFTLDTLTESIMDFSGLDRDDAETIARTESSAVLNSAREIGYEERGEGDELFYWSGAEPGDDRQTEACRWLIEKTNPFHGGEPVPLQELRELVDEAPQHDDDMNNALARPDSWVVHPNERSTFVKAPRNWRDL